jgi:transposase
VIGSSARLRVFAHREPIDMRKSYNGLSALVRDAFGQELLDGDVFLFVGKNRRRAKALFWDGTGLCIYQKRLEKGRFANLRERVASGNTSTLALSMSELALFFEGSEFIGNKSLSPGAFALERDGQVMFASSRREHSKRA